MASSIKKNSTYKKVLEGGKKIAYWKQSAAGNMEKGITYIEYEGKSQTLINMIKDRFNDIK